MAGAGPLKIAKRLKYMWTNFYPHYIHQDVPRKPSLPCRNFFWRTRTQVVVAVQIICHQEPSASECMAIADRSLTRLTNHRGSELAPLGLRGQGRRSPCSVFFLSLLCQRPRTFTHS